MAAGFINVDELSRSSSCDSSPDVDVGYENSLESPLASCFIPDMKSEPPDDYSSSCREPKFQDNHILTQLVTYRPSSESGSPPVYAGMHTMPDNEQYLMNDQLPLPPVEIHEEQPLRTHPLFSSYEPDDYRNPFMMAPFLSGHEPETADVPNHILRNEPVVNGHDHESELKRLRQCPKCGRGTSHNWWRDGTGNYLCESCYGLPPPEKPKPKPQRRTSQKKNLNQTCWNCQTTHTSLWRRDPNSNTVCNACGLYYKLHGCDRPQNMRKDSIQKRKRKPKSPKQQRKGSNLLHPSSIISQNSVAAAVSTSACLPPYASLPPYTTQANLVRVSKDSNSTTHVLPSVHSADGFRSSVGHYPIPFAPTTVTNHTNDSMCNASSCNGLQSHVGGYDDVPKSEATTSPTLSSLLTNSNHHYNGTFQH